MSGILGLGLVQLNHIIAFAGGGGSGGGGGGLIFLIGYVPMHLLGAFIRKAKNHEEKWVMGQVIAWVITGAFTIFLLVLGAYGSGLFIISAIGAPIGMGAGLYSWFGKIRTNKKTKAALAVAAQSDAAWDEDALISHATKVFLQYQKDWSNYDTASMASYMTPNYHNHATLMAEALKMASRRDAVNDPVVTAADIISIYDSTDNSQDEVIVGFSATANDQLIDTRDDKVLYTDKNATEFWRFFRSGDTWLLDGIQPATANQWSANLSLEQFAKDNGYYYSLDWGYLLLPSRGQLFGEGKFGVSDINNHVIGVYNNNIIQLYTYSPKPGAAGGKTYLVAQTTIPRSYGEILVRHKSGIHLFGVRGLNQISTEWPDFNKKYDVYATNAEQATSLELLEPVYMEQLEALSFEVNINVVDNVVYLYAQVKTVNVSVDYYQGLLTVLQKAFQQMRM